MEHEEEILEQPNQVRTATMSTWEPAHRFSSYASDTKGLSTRGKSIDDEKKTRFSTFRKIFRAGTIRGMQFESDSSDEEDSDKPSHRPNSFLSGHRLSSSTSSLHNEKPSRQHRKTIHTESVSEYEIAQRKKERRATSQKYSSFTNDNNGQKHDDKYFKKWMKKLHKGDIEKKAKQGFLVDDEVDTLIEMATGHFVTEPSEEEECKRLACFALAGAAFPVETVAGCRKKLIGNGLLEPFLHYAVDNVKDDNETEDDTIPALTVHTEIKESEIEIIKQIAHGASAKIYLAKYKGKEVAVKVFDKNHISFSLKEFKRELFILSVLQNEHFVRCYGGCVSSSKPFIVSEYMSKGPLTQFLKEDFNFMDFKIMLKFANDISAAMKWLHSLNIIHRDLKSMNILINNNMVCKIIDFGTSRVIDVDKTMTGNLGTPQWISPELFRAERYTEKADVYSFGIVLWEILTGKEPFREVEQTWKIPELVVSGYRPPIDTAALPAGSEYYVEIMKLCWDDNPEKRPSFEELEYAFGCMLKNLNEDGTYKTDLNVEKLLTVETFCMASILIRGPFPWLIVVKLRKIADKVWTHCRYRLLDSHKDMMEGKVESRNENILNGPLEQYRSIRKIFQDLLSSTYPQLHYLGRAVWESNFNPEEKKYLVAPQPIKNEIYQRINQLLDIIYGIPVYCYNTEVYFYDDSDLFVKNEEGDWISAGQFMHLNIPLLKSVAKPSPFGDLDKMETVFDKSVRDALEITEFYFEKDVVPDFVRKSILSQIRRAMKLQNIELVPQKINIYEKGGFFKPHTDTPTNPGTTIGSLVLYLPSKFTGGEFVITHNNQKQNLSHFNRSTNSAAKWIAFYSDCIHEVLPVKSGTRITITFSIDVIEEPVDNENIIEDDDEEDEEDEDYGMQVETGPSILKSVEERQKALDELVQTLNQALESSFGFVLDHKYTHSALDLHILKGSDRDLAERLKKEGYTIELRSVLYKTHVVIPENEYTSRPSISRKSVFSWTKEDMEWAIGKGPKPQFKLKPMPFFRVGPLGDPLDSEDVLGAQHTGNECRDSEHQKLYWNSALIIHKPTWWTRARLVWIAKMKNGEECFLAKLPAELIQLIINFLPRQAPAKYRVGDYVRLTERIYRPEDAQIVAIEDGQYKVQYQDDGKEQWFTEEQLDEEQALMYVSDEEQLDEEPKE